MNADDNRWMREHSYRRVAWNGKDADGHGWILA